MEYLIIKELQLIFGEENVPRNRGEAFRAIINFYTGETGGKKSEKLSKSTGLSPSNIVTSRPIMGV